MRSLQLLLDILKHFSPVFSRSRTHLIFCIAMLSVICGHGASCTEMARFFGGGEAIYHSILRLFYSSAWSTSALQNAWIGIVYKYLKRYFYTVNGKPVFILDRTVIEKFGRKMYGVNKQYSTLRSHSVNGHALEMLGIAVNKGQSTICLPLGFTFLWKTATTMQSQLCNWIGGLKKSIPEPGYLVADAYYSKKEVIRAAEKSHFELISRVRSDAVAYREAPKVKKKTRGRPKTYGEKVTIKNLFNNEHKSKFSNIVVGGEQHQFYMLDLIWKPVAKKVRFVLMKIGKTNMILISTDLNLKPKQIAELYLRRCSIERSFRFGKQNTKLGLYRFWSKATHTKLKKRECYKKHAMVSLISQGLLQMLAIKFPQEIWAGSSIWLRTLDESRPPSEEVTQFFLKSLMVRFLASQGETLQKIQKLLNNGTEELNSTLSGADSPPQAA